MSHKTTNSLWNKHIILYIKLVSFNTKLLKTGLSFTPVSIYEFLKNKTVKGQKWKTKCLSKHKIVLSLKMFSYESDILYNKIAKTDIFSKNALYLKIQLHQDFF